MLVINSIISVQIVSFQLIFEWQKRDLTHVYGCAQTDPRKNSCLRFVPFNLTPFMTFPVSLDILLESCEAREASRLGLASVFLAVAGGRGLIEAISCHSDTF
jgi:hypothetical protein